MNHDQERLCGKGERIQKMEKIEIKLKECCLACEHFDLSGIKGLSYPVFVCGGEPKRVIACGHMNVCKTYLEHMDNRQLLGGNDGKID